MIHTHTLDQLLSSLSPHSIFALHRDKAASLAVVALASPSIHTAIVAGRDVLQAVLDHAALLALEQLILDALTGFL